MFNGWCIYYYFHFASQLMQFHFPVTLASSFASIVRLIFLSWLPNIIIRIRLPSSITTTRFLFTGDFIRSFKPCRGFIIVVFLRRLYQFKFVMPSYHSIAFFKFYWVPSLLRGPCHQVIALSYSLCFFSTLLDTAVTSGSFFRTRRQPPTLLVVQNSST